MAKMKEFVYQTKENALWESFPVNISLNRRIATDEKPCKHAHSRKVITSKDYREKPFKEATWVVPIVVIATNEGGYNTTGVCFDCLKEQVDEALKANWNTSKH